jgi:acetoin utilization deacetylase AcuC-like enzyme
MPTSASALRHRRLARGAFDRAGHGTARSGERSAPRTPPREPFGGIYPAAVRAVHSPLHLLHEPAFEVFSGHLGPAFETPARAEAIRAALAADAAFTLELPAEHGLEPARAVHDPGLLRFLADAWDAWREAGGATDGLMADTVLHPGLRGGAGRAPEPSAPAGRVGYWCFDTSTPITVGAWPAARAALDVALTAAEAVLGGEAVAYGLCRPPGHHAGRTTYGGYCYLNNAAIAAQHLVRAGAGRVGILDVDFHHGNGTQEVFWEREDVPYASLHGDPDRVYPYFTGHADETGGGPGAGATFNQPLPAGTDDATYLAALERALDWLAGRHDGIVIVSLGVDTYGLDPICDFGLTTPVYHEVGRRVAATGARLVVLQEGGYHLGDLGENVRQWLRGADGLAAEPVAG